MKKKQKKEETGRWNIAGYAHYMKRVIRDYGLTEKQALEACRLNLKPYENPKEIEKILIKIKEEYEKKKA